MQLAGAAWQLLWGRDAPTATCYKKWQKITLACRCFVILTPATPSSATSPHSPPHSRLSSTFSCPNSSPGSVCNSLYALFTLERIVAHLPLHKWEFWALASDRQRTEGGWGSWWWVQSSTSSSSTSRWCSKWASAWFSMALNRSDSNNEGFCQQMWHVAWFELKMLSQMCINLSENFAKYTHSPSCFPLSP